MTTSLQTLRQELGLEVNDGYTSSLTGNGAADGTTIIDTDLKNYQTDQFSDGASGDQMTWIKLTSGTYSGQERSFSSYAAATGTITVKAAFGGQVLSGVTYELHKIWTPTQKNNAIVFACRKAFPACYKKVDDTSIVFGNWLRNGHFETWTLTTTPDKWAATTATAAQETTDSLVHGYGHTSSCKLSGAYGYLYTDIALQRDLGELHGESLTFKVWAWADTASQARLTIYDGATTTNSEYHTGDSKWRELEVTATIAANPVDVEVRCNYDAGTACYFDDARLFGGSTKYSYDISDLGLYNNRPLQVLLLGDEYTDAPRPSEILLRNWTPPSTDGRLRFSSALSQDDVLRIIGMGLITTPTSTTSTEVDEPQVRIIIAEAAAYLCNLKLQMTNLKDAGRWAELKQVWAQEATERRRGYMQTQPSITLHW